MGGIEAWIGLDIGKADHHATVIDTGGGVLFGRGVRNDMQAIERLLDSAGANAALVIDQPGSIGTPPSRSRRRGIPVVYVPGLVMRRASQLYPSAAKTDRRDSFVIANTERIDQAQVHELRVLGGQDDDLAHDRYPHRQPAARRAATSRPPQSSVSSAHAWSTPRSACCFSITRYPQRRAVGKRRLLRPFVARAPRMSAHLVDDPPSAALDARIRRRAGRRDDRPRDR